MAEPGLVAAVNADGKLAATGDAKGAITLWDLASGKPAKTLAGHTGPISGLKFLPAAEQTQTPERLVSTSADKTIRIWNPADGAVLAKIDTPTPITALAVLADGDRLATGGPDNLVRIWALPAQPTRTIADIPGAVTAVAESGDKRTIAVAAADGNIALVEAASGKTSKTLAGRKVPVTALSFSARRRSPGRQRSRRRGASLGCGPGNAARDAHVGSGHGRRLARHGQCARPGHRRGQADHLEARRAGRCRRRGRPGSAGHGDRRQRRRQTGGDRHAGRRQADDRRARIGHGQSGGRAGGARRADHGTQPECRRHARWPAGRPTRPPGCGASPRAKSWPSSPVTAAR